MYISLDTEELEYSWGSVRGERIMGTRGWNKFSPAQASWARGIAEPFYPTLIPACIRLSQRVRTCSPLDRLTIDFITNGPWPKPEPCMTADNI